MSKKYKKARKQHKLRKRDEGFDLSGTPFHLVRTGLQTYTLHGAGVPLFKNVTWQQWLIIVNKAMGHCRHHVTRKKQATKG